MKFIHACIAVASAAVPVDTDIPDRDAAYLRPSFGRWQDGSGSIAGGTVVASLTAAF